MTVKVRLAGYEPDTIAFELAGIGDPVDLADMIEMWCATGDLPEYLRRDDPELPSRG